MQDFIVIDTEGKDYIREIAVINQQGELIYEAFTKEYFKNNEIKQNLKPLKQIILDFLPIAQDKLIICHFAQHDREVLYQSCLKVQIRQPKLKFDCSVKLSQQYYPHLQSYSLAYLSKKLGLKVNQKFFNPEQAHTARYDAQFTYQLYCKILESKAMNQPLVSINPFSSNRVDNPFEDHLDLKSINQEQFEQLKWIITDIKQDKNHQSKGTVVIGEAGSGKTHLMMRLAKELLKVNRLLFIRCPNNADSVLFHIYSRILESFAEKIPETDYTQIDALLAHSFVKLISQTGLISLTQRDQEIITILKSNPLEIYEKLGAEGTAKKLAYWGHIEKRTTDWWMSKYGLAGHSLQIIKGIIKYCSYSKPDYKRLIARWLSAEELSVEDLKKIGLEKWDEEMSKEAFSLEAISVFSNLSLLDEPLIIIFDQLEALGLKHHEQLLLAFGEAIKEVFTHVPNSLVILNLFPDRWEQFQLTFDDATIDRVSQNQLYLQRPSNEYLTEILKAKIDSVGLSIEKIFSPTELESILNHSSIRKMINSASDHYHHKIHGVPLPAKAKLVKPDHSELEENNEQSSILETRITNLENNLQQFTTLFQKIGKTLLEFNFDFDHKFDNTETFQETRDPEAPETKIEQFIRQNRPLLEKEYEKLQIINDSDDLGKFLEIAEAFKIKSNYTIDCLRLGKKKIPENCVIQYADQSFAIAFLELDGTTFTSRIKNFNELVINHREINFQLWRDARKNNITGKVGKDEIEMLNNSHHGRFLIMEKGDRIDFELIYKLITDVHNRDLEIELDEVLSSIISLFKDCWIIKILTA